MKTRIAKALLRQREDRRRHRMILVYLIVLVLLLAAHAYFSNLSSPLRLIPQTAAAMGMGFVVLCIVQLRQFTSVAEFIDWQRVLEVAERSTAADAVRRGHSP